MPSSEVLHVQMSFVDGLAAAVAAAQLSRTKAGVLTLSLTSSTAKFMLFLRCRGNTLHMLGCSCMAWSSCGTL